VKVSCGFFREKLFFLPIKLPENVGTKKNFFFSRFGLVVVKKHLRKLFIVAFY
jgi:hypothetical protein